MSMSRVVLALSLLLLTSTVTAATADFALSLDVPATELDCHFFNFDPSTSQTLELTFRANDKESDMFFDATVTTTSTDPNPSNDHATATTHIFPMLDLKLDASVFPTLQPGKVSTARFAITNLSSTHGGTTTLFVTLPPPIEVVDAPWFCDAIDASNWHCAMPGETGAGIVSVTPRGDRAAASISARVETTQQGWNAGNNRIALDAPVAHVGDLKATISAPDRTDDQSSALITTRIENAAAFDAKDVVVDFLPQNDTIISAVAPTDWNCVRNPEQFVPLRCSIPLLAAHSTSE